MSNAIAYARPDPYRLPAGILTLVAHVVFFALLYLGINWQAQQPQGMVVDLWNTLPDVNNAPSQSVQPGAEQAALPPVAEPVKPVKPQQQPDQAVAGKADIELAEKKKKQKPLPKETVKPVSKQQMTKAEQKRAQAEQQDLIRQQEQAEQQAQDARAKQAAAMGQLIDEYSSKIRAKITRNVVLPPDVEDDALAKFDVTLLPGGEVFEVKLTRKSGNAAYDSAVERAIWKASPLPVPTDSELFNKKFRNLHLNFRPKDRE